MPSHRRREARVEALRQRYDVVVIDCAAWFNDTTLGILDVADIVLTVLTLEITSIKNIRLFLRSGREARLRRQDPARPEPSRHDAWDQSCHVEHSIGRKVDNTIVSDGRAVVYR